MENPVSMPFSRGIHRFAVLLAFATLLLVIAGAFVTSNDAGLAVPDWPTSFGSFYKMPPMVGGIKYEHGHRMIAEAIGMLTVILGFLILRGAQLFKAAAQAVAMTALFIGAIVSVALGHQTPTHPALIATATALGLTAIFGIGALGTALILVGRAFAQHWPVEAKVAIIAMPTVMLQGVFGGLTVLLYLPWYISTLHATVAQTFFCITVLLAIVTSAEWKAARPLTVPGRKDKVIRMHAYASMAAVYLQLMLGAAFRHNGISIKWHIFWALGVTVLLLATGFRILVEYGKNGELRKPSVALISVLILQLLLGFAAYMTRVVWSKDAVQPLTSMVLSTVSHVSGGAVLLAITWWLAAQISHVLAGKSADVLEFRNEAVNV